MMQEMFALQTATINARARMGDDSISTRVHAGVVQVVRVNYDSGGSSIVGQVSGWISMSEAASFLDEMGI
jgi:hypothetical protein